LFGSRRVADGVRLEVWDTGPGIPEDQHEQIFREFHSLSRQGRAHFKGLGLGLAIADRICRLLAHPCGLRSWPGRGTVFSVTVPLARNIEQSPVTAAQSASPRDLAGLRVLCVDNDSALLAGLVAVLQGFGCDVLSATGLEDARRVLAGKAPPDIVLVDYQLDDEDGFDVIDALDADWDEVVPAVLMTADRRAEIRERALEQGLAFLQKPITDTALREMLESL
ncbi:MAG: response regulator, partial [Alcanivoracaceae bacterium]|nr:response regulator [Alcanivoracaceae bacterium]